MTIYKVNMTLLHVSRPPSGNIVYHIIVFLTFHSFNFLNTNRFTLICGGNEESKLALDIVLVGIGNTINIAPSRVYCYLARILPCIPLPQARILLTPR